MHRTSSQLGPGTVAARPTPETKAALRSVGQLANSTDLVTGRKTHCSSKKANGHMILNLTPGGAQAAASAALNPHPSVSETLTE